MPLIDQFGPTKIMAAQASTGAGQAFSNNVKLVGGMVGIFAWQTTYTGAPTGVSVTLQGSLDGVNWFTIDTTINTAGELRTTGAAPSPATFLRANVGTLTGGSSPTVTVIIQPGG